MVVHRPNGIKAKVELREQFQYVIDVVPTTLEAAGIPKPTSVNGIPQKPIEGASMMYSFDESQAEDRRKPQYCEMAINRAICHDG